MNWNAMSFSLENVFDCTMTAVFFPNLNVLNWCAGIFSHPKTSFDWQILLMFGWKLHSSPAPSAEPENWALITLTHWGRDNMAAISQTKPDSNVHGANMGPIWGRQDPGGPHVGPMNFAIWDNFKCIFFNKNVWISIKIWLNFVPMGPISNITALVLIMAWVGDAYMHHSASVS